MNALLKLSVSGFIAEPFARPYLFRPLSEVVLFGFVYLNVAQTEFFPVEDVIHRTEYLKYAFKRHRSYAFHARKKCVRVGGGNAAPESKLFKYLIAVFGLNGRPEYYLCFPLFTIP